MSNLRTIYLVPAGTVCVSPPHTQQQRQQRIVAVRNAAQPTTTAARRCPPPVAQQPQKRCAPMIDPVEELLAEPGQMCPPRKRERLNHLTPEEKLNRRKFKNRVAAQTARDRKKVRSQRLEDVVRDLLEENKSLREDNMRLREEKQQLLVRNEKTFESAAFISGPQQREQVFNMLLVLMPILSLLALFLKQNSTESSRISRKTSISINSPQSCHMTKMMEEYHPLRIPLSAHNQWILVS